MKLKTKKLIIISIIATVFLLPMIVQARPTAEWYKYGTRRTPPASTIYMYAWTGVYGSYASVSMDCYYLSGSYGYQLGDQTFYGYGSSEGALAWIQPPQQTYTPGFYEISTHRGPDGLYATS